jgi:cyclic 2,3-diphosphoglycerate synthetase
VKAIALIDGEHHADVVRDALAELPFDFVGAILVGGTEKLRGGEEYDVPLLDSLEDARAEAVVDLSDEPVLGPRERMLWASRALALGKKYIGPDFTFEPPHYQPFTRLPSLAVIGTGKRIGKTAVTGHVARLLSARMDVVVVSMGRGGPREPEIVEVAPTLEALLEISRAGRHAASDYLETAALAGVPTIGCRRAGGGLAGQVFSSNVSRGAELVEERGADLAVFDGSGAAIPPVAVNARILVVGPGQDATAYLNAYRVLISDLVLLVGGGDPGPIRELKDVPVIGVELRLRPVEPISGRRVAVFTTGPAPVDHLDADVVHVSRNLANRAALREELERVDAEVYLTEIKAAAIDVVAEAAAERGAEIVFADNEVLSLAGEPDLDEQLLALAEETLQQTVTRSEKVAG